MKDYSTLSEQEWFKVTGKMSPEELAEASRPVCYEVLVNTRKRKAAIAMTMRCGRKSYFGGLRASVEGCTPAVIKELREEAENLARKNKVGFKGVRRI